MWYEWLLPGFVHVIDGVMSHDFLNTFSIMIFE